MSQSLGNLLSLLSSRDFFLSVIPTCSVPITGAHCSSSCFPRREVGRQAWAANHRGPKEAVGLLLNYPLIV